MAYEKEDFYTKKARELGYRSRSAFKLKELNDKFKIIKKGDRVLDLGSAPGGWMQVIREIIGSKGYLLGIDIQFFEQFSERNVDILIRDITDTRTLEKIKKKKKFDVVTSDLAPKTSGIKTIDKEKSLELSNIAFDIAINVLKEKGNLLIKVFDSEKVKNLKADLKKNFKEVKQYRPRATRKSSYEVYLMGFRKLN